MNSVIKNFLCISILEIVVPHFKGDWASCEGNQMCSIWEQIKAKMLML